MKNKDRFFEWLLFAMIAVAFCALLSFRPIPGIDAANDTGRYVEGFREYCSNSLFSDQVNEKISYQFFHLIFSLACLTGGDRAFLFVTAFILPLAVLLFASWKDGSLLWASTLLLSVFGLELMTNAMRQSLGMVVFFGALATVKNHGIKALILGALAVVAHASVLAFIPFLFWMFFLFRLCGVWSRGFLWLIALIVCFFVIVCIGIIDQIHFLNFSEPENYLVNVYSEKYAEQLNVSFVLFLVLPLYFVYGIRRFFENNNVTDLERKGVIYSTVILIFCYLFFPFITYRYALFSVAMQIFLVAISERHRREVGLIALIGLISHLVVMFLISGNFDVLIRG